MLIVLGVSDAFLSQHATKDHIVRIITLYDKINLDKEKIHNGVSILLRYGSIVSLQLQFHNFSSSIIVF